MKVKDNCIYNMDCFEGMRNIKEDYIDMIFTDPPYGIDFKSGWSNHEKSFDKIENDSNLDFVPLLFKELDRISKPNSSLYMFVGVQTMDVFMSECKKYYTIRNLIVVPRTQKGGSGSLKMQFSPQNEYIIYATKGKKNFEKTEILRPSVRYLKDKRRKNVPEWLYRLPDYWKWCRAGVYNNEREHPTEKHISTPETAIKLSSKINEIIFDPFIGSGSSMMAAKKLNRKFIGFEVNKNYYEISKKRIEEIS